jgi:prolyl-tRNA synthetase
VIRKVEAIIREEMNRAGAVELLMPVVQPAELWQETGRFAKMGPELLRVKDRHDRDFIIQPTSEEVITDIARQELRSYKQLPRNFYHIQTKFRDERRPRFGVMRGREFTMKDAYSFDRDFETGRRSYDAMFGLLRIFDRIGLQYRAVAADSGAIGGDQRRSSRSSPTPAKTPSSTAPPATTRPTSSWPRRGPAGRARDARQALAKTPTPGKSTCADVAQLLGLPLTATVKSLVLATDELDEHGRRRQDHRLAAAGARRPRPERGQGRQGAGAEGRLPLRHRGRDRRPLRLQAGLPGPDRPEASRSRWWPTAPWRDGDFVCGANEADFHYTGVNWGRDLPEPDLVADIRNVVAGDPSPDGKGVLAIQRGIEVGHVFYLGTKYSEAMNATYLDETGKPQPWRWAATASASRACWARPSSRTTTSAASSGRRRWRRSPW